MSIATRKTNMEKNQRVFVSYSHDSIEHSIDVLKITNKLRASGIDCIIDQFVGEPEEGWPRWMDRQIMISDYVLVVCTEIYYRRIVGEEVTGKGLGVRWEGHLIYQYIYDEGTINKRFIPVVLKSEDVKWIPTPLRGATRYNMNDEKGFDSLYRKLNSLSVQVDTPLSNLNTDRSGVVMNKYEKTNIVYNSLPLVSIGELFIGREEIIKSIEDDLVSTKSFGSTHPIQVLSGVGGQGKTRTAIEYAWKYRLKYRALLYASIGSRGKIHEAFANLFDTLRIEKEHNNSVAQKHDIVIDWFNDNEGWLLLIDNVDSDDAIDSVIEILPRLSKGHVIICSRDESNRLPPLSPKGQ